MTTDIEIKSPNSDFCLAGPKANPKQISFIEAAYSGKYRFLAYGGAIRGGKSYVVLYCLHTLCMTYPGSKWIIVRATLPVLKKTTIPSFKKLVQTKQYGKWNNSAPITFTYFNGSQLMFVPESKTIDPDLTNFLGFECNGFFLEQAEELSEDMWNMALQRAGSLYIENMPPGLIFSTFNPTQNWVKQKFYVPYSNNQLEPPYFFLPALPSDNPHVTPDQYANWDRMSERDRDRFIKGDWTDYGANGLWAFAFERNKHIGFAEPKGDEKKAPELNPSQIVYLSFDFNRNPISCSVIQLIENQIRVLETIKLPNSDIYAMCMYILATYPEMMFMVTGDASGNNGSALVKDNVNYYIVISKQLRLASTQIRVPSKNPSLEENQLLVNSLLSNFDIIIHEKKAAGLIYDMQNVKMLPDGTIEKRNREDPTMQADALDTFRYFCNTFMRRFIERPV